METGQETQHLHMAITNRITRSGLRTQQTRAALVNLDTRHALERERERGGIHDNIVLWEHMALELQGSGNIQSWKQRYQGTDRLRHTQSVNGGDGALGGVSR